MQRYHLGGRSLPCMLEALHSWHCPQTPLTFEHVDVCLYSQNSRKGSGVQGQHELHSELKVYKTPPKKKKKKKKKEQRSLRFFVLSRLRQASGTQVLHALSKHMMSNLDLSFSASYIPVDGLSWLFPVLDLRNNRS